MTNTQRALLESKITNLVAMYKDLKDLKLRAILIDDIHKLNDLLIS